MKCLYKSIATLATIGLLFSSTIFADDFGEESFGDDFGSFGGEMDSFGGDEGSERSVQIGGKVNAGVRVYVDENKVEQFSDLKEFAVASDPTVRFNFDYSGPATEINAKIKLNRNILESQFDDVIEEVTARAYVGDFILEAGKMKMVWGKGDKLHVVDNFNANDFSDFIIPDYIDRRIAEPMAHIVWNIPVASMRAEFVYTPTMSADRAATKGVWVPSSFSALEAMTKEIKGAKLLALLKAKDAIADTTSLAYIGASTLYLEELSASSKMTASDMLPNTKKLEYGQLGTRFCATAGPLDLGLSYYYGHYKQPSVDLSKYLYAKGIESNLGTAGFLDHVKTNDALPSIHYDVLNAFGAEIAGVAGPFNMKGEFSYNMSLDFKGDDPWVHNNSIAWLAGFDIDLPINNVNVNIQEIGSYLLKSDSIGSGSNAPYKVYDVDYKKNGYYTDNRLVVNISDTYMHEKLKVECTGIWGIENVEFVVMPKVSLSVKDGFKVGACGAWIYANETYGKNGQFNDFKKNSFVELSASYTF